MRRTEALERFQAQIDSGRVLIGQARFGDAGLPPDWVELAGKDLRLPKGLETVFGFNAGWAGTNGVPSTVTCTTG